MNAEQKQQLIAEQCLRNEVEEVFGSGKHKYSFKLIMARLINDAEASISMTFLVMCAEKIQRLLSHVFVVFLPGFTACSGVAYQGRCRRS